MLANFRSLTKSWVIKGILLVIASSFGLFFGISDIYHDLTRPKGVAKVGNYHISAQEFAHYFGIKQMEHVARLERKLGAPVDLNSLNLQALKTIFLEQLIEQTIIDLEAERIGFVVGDDLVRTVIHQNSIFHTDNIFDHAKFTHVIKNFFRMDEAQFIVRTKKEIARFLLIQGIIPHVGKVPEGVLLPYLQSLHEKREVDYIKIEFAKQKINKAPSDEELNDFIVQNQNLFTKSEMRRASIIAVDHEKIKQQIQITDEEMRQYYHANQGSFMTPKRWSVSKLFFDDTVTYHQGISMLQAGYSFEGVVKKLDRVALSAKYWVAASDFSKADYQQVASLQPGQYTNALSDDKNGIYMLRVNEIETPKLQKFEEVKDQIKNYLYQEKFQKLRDEGIKLLEDTIASGATIEELKQKTELLVTEVGPLNREGNFVEGENSGAKPAFALSDAVVEAIFNTPSGQDSGIIELEPDNFGILIVSEVIPERALTFAEAASDAKLQWSQQQQISQAYNLSQQIIDEFKQNKSFAELGKKLNLNTKANQVFTRDSFKENKANNKLEEGITSEFVHKIFNSNINQPVIYQDQNQLIVVVLKRISPAAREDIAEELNMFNDTMSSNLTQDLLEQYINSIKSRYPTTVYTKFLSEDHNL